ncbi:MAG: hypothetical protein HYW62_00405 [Candidatus Levybacteria bacterium]|nr:hypothetical protein [Candidatus Levybacteria bacterium]
MSPERGIDRKRKLARREKQRGLRETFRERLLQQNLEQRELQIKQEAEKGEFVFWKQLKLITPQQAERLGIWAETPVFISPLISEKGICYECQEEYSPIIYGHGLVTAQHFHRPGNGGIYHNKSLPSFFTEQERTNFKNFKWPHWIAILDPIGPGPIQNEEWSRFSPTIATSSEKAYVREIRAFSVNGEIKKGALLERTDSSLAPFINLHSDDDIILPFNLPEFEFRITETGEVLFTKISPPKPTS